MDPGQSNLSQQEENDFWSKMIEKIEKCINHGQSMPNHTCHKHHLR